MFVIASEARQSHKKYIFISFIDFISL